MRVERGRKERAVQNKKGSKIQTQSPSVSSNLRSTRIPH